MSVVEVPSASCAHQFVLDKKRWFRRGKELWTCRLCGSVTRHYDSIDFAGCRPIHPHMSVAYRGVNTVERDHPAAPESPAEPALRADSVQPDQPDEGLQE